MVAVKARCWSPSILNLFPGCCSFPIRCIPLAIRSSCGCEGDAAEFQDALKLIPARTVLMEVEGGQHDLGYGKQKSKANDLPARIVAQFRNLMG